MTDSLGASRSLPDHPVGVATLILGVLGLVGIPVLAPIAWFLAYRARKEVAAPNAQYAGGSVLTAGYVLGIVGTVLWLLGVLAVVFFFGTFFALLGISEATTGVDWVALRFMVTMFALTMAVAWAASSRN